MNDQSARCDVCGEDAFPREWLRCMLCGNRYHYAPDSALADNCGIVAPNPESKNGC